MFHMELFHVEPELNPWFVTGFCEGAGSFTYSRSGRGLGLYFALKVGATDLPLLQRIQRFFAGAGRVYHISAGSEGDGKLGGSLYYRVTRRRELELIVAHFDGYPLAGARRDQYGLWRGMVALKQRFRKPDIAKLNEIAARLSHLRQRRFR